MLLLSILITIISYLTQILVIAIIIQFALSLLIMFNVVNPTNQFVAAIYTAINAILDPILRPIRRILPDTGMIDFSPLVLIIALQLLQMILGQIQASMYV